MSKKLTVQKLSLKEIQSHQPDEKVLLDRTATLPSLLYENIKCLYWVENHLVIALPKMIAAAGTAELQAAFEEHLSVTEGHVQRLEKIFKLIKQPAMAKKSDALEGLAMDGEHLIEETTAGSDARQTGLIMAGQLVENYEITAYTGVITLAQKLGHKEIAEILSQTLREEAAASVKLTELAKA